MQIFIGRGVSGAQDIIVPNIYTSVSRKHARFYFANNAVYVEDLSTNGTFVNELKIKTKRISSDDEISLGIDNPPYPIDVKEIIRILVEYNNANKKDYTSEFLALKTVYSEYQNDLDRLSLRIKLKSTLPRIIISIIVVISILFIDFGGNENAKTALTTGAGALGMIASFFGTKNSISQEKREVIILKHNCNFLCPKCQSKLHIHKNSWNMLQDKGSCLNNECDAEFKN